MLSPIEEMKMRGILQVLQQGRSLMEKQPSVEIRLAKDKSHVKQINVCRTRYSFMVLLQVDGQSKKVSLMLKTKSFRA